MPKISVIVPCYNQAQYLDDCLQSVLEQTYTDWECLIINDGSPDNTEEVAKRWVEKDARFRYFKKENQGVTKARDFGLDSSQGEWILFLDADDLLKPEKFQHSLAFELSHDLIITDFEMLDNNTVIPAFCNLSKYQFNFKNILEGWDIDFNLPIHCALINKAFLGKIRFDSCLKAKEDWVFWLKVFDNKNIRVKFITEALCIYRMNSNGASKNFSSVYQDQLTANKYVYEHFGEEAKTILFNKLNKMLFTLNNENLDQKNYIRQLQNTKVLKYYLKLRAIFQR